MIFSRKENTFFVHHVKLETETAKDDDRKLIWLSLLPLNVVTSFRIYSLACSELYVRKYDNLIICMW